MSRGGETQASTYKVRCCAPRARGAQHSRDAAVIRSTSRQKNRDVPGMVVPDCCAQRTPAAQHLQAGAEYGQPAEASISGIGVRSEPPAIVSPRPDPLATIGTA